MDTRYWGPSAWRLLHLISFSNSPNTADVCEFFATLPYVLPCKFCRCSLSEYMLADPPTPSKDLGRWMWRIHNDVNAKLRREHIPTAPDPPFNKVRQIYEERLSAGCTRTTFDGWEFLFSVAEAHPMGLNGRTSTPLQGAPPAEVLATAPPLLRNRWNVMQPAERLPFYERFWHLLPRVLPFPEWQRIASKGCGGMAEWSTRAATLKSLWGIRCAMERELELLNRTTYASLCKELRTFRSGCGTGRGKTCRRKRG